MWEDILKNYGKRPYGRDRRYRKLDEPFEPFKRRNEKKFKPKCGNDGCLRIANGTDGIGFCMHCEDDASGNRLTDPKSPHTRKNQMEKPTLPNIYVGDEK